MAPVARDWEYSNSFALAYFSAAAVGSSLLLAFIGSTIWRLPSNLPPSSSTRHHEAQRRRHAPLFAALAASSLFLAFYYTVVRYRLSYEFWVSHHGTRQDIPNTLPGQLYTPANADDSLQLGRWFASQNIPLQFYGIIAERSRRFWWGQQFFTGLITWSTFVGIEGHRRGFRPLTKLAFVLVAQFLSLSAAQNLFYIALLLRPVQPTSQHALDPPNSAIYISFALLGIFFAADLPLRYGEALFNESLLGTLVVIPILLTVLSDITPTKFRTAHQNIHLTHRSYATVFTSVSLFALATHAWFTGVAILDNTPPIHSRHRSVFSWPFHYSASEEHPNHLQEAEVAVSSLLGAIGDHPAVNAVGWDVLLSTVSLGVWCIVHGVDVDGMIGCGIWPWHNSAKDNSTEAQSPKHVTFDRAAKQEDGDTAQPSPKKKGRARSTKKSNDITSGIVDEASKSAQKIGEAISGSTRRRRTRNRDHHAEDGEDADDDDYVPDRTTAAELASWEHEEDHSDTGTEAGALAWGLWAIGGLGFATASALGSEVVEA